MTNFRALDRLGDRTPPHYGVVVLAALLIGASALCVYFQLNWPGDRPHGPRTGPASAISALPDVIVLSRWPMHLCGVGFIVGTALWAAHRCLPWSAALTAASFTGVVAFYLENSTQVTHVAHLTNMLLWVYALWYGCYAGDLKAALRDGGFWSTPLFPRWVYLLSVFAVGFFYGMSGLLKWLTSGLDWPNGVSMQLWVALFGRPNSLAGSLVLGDRRIAAAMQWAALIGETAGFVAILSRRLRPWIGLLLIGFHFGQIDLFGWGFHSNMLILALVFLPFYEWIPRWVAARRADANGRSGSVKIAAADQSSDSALPLAGLAIDRSDGETHNTQHPGPR